LNTTQTESNENRNYHPYLGKRNNNIIYFYEVTTTSMLNFTKTPMKSEQTGQYLFWVENGALWELRLLNLNVIDIDLFVHFSWVFW
jgi:hypothetical protein